MLFLGFDTPKEFFYQVFYFRIRVYDFRIYGLSKMRDAEKILA